jgi:uncharacterized membrane-anchored protein
MNKHVRQIVLFVVLLVTFAVIDVQIYKKEMTLSSGKVMLLELAPRDPRSLMQGDYMVLRYKVAVEVGPGDAVPREGKLVMNVDEQGVATFKRVHTPGSPLAPGEHLLRYRKRGREIRLGAESFFFQEGHANNYSGAKYGELRVVEAGDSVLAGLRGQNLEKLGPDKEYAVRLE